MADFDHLPARRYVASWCGWLALVRQQFEARRLLSSRSVPTTRSDEFQIGFPQMTKTLIVPGLRSSGPAHWQTWLEQRIPGTARVRQNNWNDPHLPDWSARVRQEIVRAPGKVFIAAHSFGVLAAVQAAHDHADKIAGALLVAPADPDYFGLSEFLPSVKLDFPAIVVGSENDHWMSAGRAAGWAGTWGGRFLNLGQAGHINAEAGFGPWPLALALLEELRRSSESKPAHDRRVSWSGSSRRAAQPDRLGGIGRLIDRRPRSVELDFDIAARLLRDAGWHVRAPCGTAA